jgi:hypothetical protein
MKLLDRLRKERADAVKTDELVTASLSQAERIREMEARVTAERVNAAHPERSVTFSTTKGPLFIPKPLASVPASGDPTVNVRGREQQELGELPQQQTQDPRRTLGGISLMSANNDPALDSTGRP